MNTHLCNMGVANLYMIWISLNTRIMAMMLFHLSCSRRYFYFLFISIMLLYNNAVCVCVCVSGRTRISDHASGFISVRPKERSSLLLCDACKLPIGWGEEEKPW